MGRSQSFTGEKTFSCALGANYGGLFEEWGVVIISGVWEALGGGSTCSDCPFFFYSGRLRGALRSSGRLQAALGSSGRLRAAAGGCRRLWAAPGGCGQLQSTPGSSRRLQAAPGICGQLRAAPHSYRLEPKKKQLSKLSA